jgi:ribosome assembly protein 4
MSATHVIAQFQTEDGTVLDTPIDLPLDISNEQLQVLLNKLLNNEDALPYAFFIKHAYSFPRTGSSSTPSLMADQEEITDSLEKAVTASGVSTEESIKIIYVPQAVFRVQAVTRCHATLEGHTEAVLAVAFSPDSQQFASGSGDTTVRLWDIHTNTALRTMKGHADWVLTIAWSPDGQRLASGDNKGVIIIWDPQDGKKLATLNGHKKFVTAMAWEPLHQDGDCLRLVSSSKDGTAIVWNTRLGTKMLHISGHSSSVTCVVWGGEGLIYTASQDRTIRVWTADSGKLCRVLETHAHWVNHLALSNGYALRTGWVDPAKPHAEPPRSSAEARARALERYQEFMKANPRELLVSGSDDFTLCLWDPTCNKKPLIRMTGHQQPINIVSFSPDGRLIASASFDKSVKVWNGRDGSFIATFRSHVGPVYQVCWSADSRLLVTGSKDSTVKIFSPSTKKLVSDLPGHADEVYAVDWSPDGTRVGSASKDRTVKIWTL